MTPYYRQQVRAADKGCDPSSFEGNATAVLFAGLKHGTRDLSKIARVTGVPIARVKSFAWRLRRNSIWKGGITHCNWFDKDDGGIAFWLDVNVACGMLKRATFDGRAEHE